MSVAQTFDASPNPTARAADNALLKPRFYRTDYAAMNALDVTPLRDEWQKLMQV